MSNFGFDGAFVSAALAEVIVTIIEAARGASASRALDVRMLSALRRSSSAAASARPRSCRRGRPRAPWRGRRR